MPNFLSPINLGRNELQNAVVQNLSGAPENPKKGQIYFNSATNTLLYYNGTTWIDTAKSTFTGTAPITVDNESGTISISDATNSAKGVVRFATDSEVDAGTSTDSVITPKQLKSVLGASGYGTVTSVGISVPTGLSVSGSPITTAGTIAISLASGYVIPTTSVINSIANKLDKNTAITGGTHTKITYDENGLVTAGADLSASDIPNLTLAKITDVTATATELNYVKGVTSSIQTQLNTISGNISTHISNTDNPHNVTKEQVGLKNVTNDAQVKRSEMGVANGVATLGSNAKILESQLPDYILGQLLYGGNVAAGAVATLSANAKLKLGTTSATITLTDDTTAITGYAANNGIYYIATEAFTFAGISYLTGDWLISNGSNWSKIDNTDAVTGVKGDKESTYRIGNINITCANIGALPDTTTYISSITTGTENGTIAISVKGGTATNVAVKGLGSAAYKTAGSAVGNVPVIGTALGTTANVPVVINTSGQLVPHASGALGAAAFRAIDTTITSGSANLITSGAVYTAIHNLGITGKYSATITGDGSKTSFTITHNLGTKDVQVSIYDSATGEEVYTDITRTSTTAIRLDFGEAFASTQSYRVVVIG